MIGFARSNALSVLSLSLLISLIYPQYSQATSSLEIVEDFYRQASGKEPTTENLLASMEKKATNGDTRGEVSLAIAVFTERKAAPADFIKRLDACLEANPYPRVQYRGAVSYLEFDRAKGLKVAKQLIADPRHPVTYKINIASALEKKGDLSGYPILREVLQKPGDHPPQVIEGLIQQFKPHDGQPWNEQGDLVEMTEIYKLWTEFMASWTKSKGHP